jgi:hypothetical protein
VVSIVSLPMDLFGQAARRIVYHVSPAKHTESPHGPTRRGALNLGMCCRGIIRSVPGNPACRVALREDG